MFDGLCLFVSHTSWTGPLIDKLVPEVMFSTKRICNYAHDFFFRS